jgi:tRNA(adenine34) deaminase
MADDLEFMKEALAEARAAYEDGEIPVGAVIVRDGAIISRGRNIGAVRNDPTAHAEICAIREACRLLGKMKLEDCTLYTTLYPCPMCEMTIKEVGLPRVVYGGNTYRWVREVKFQKAVFEPHGPILEEECRGLFTRKLKDMGRDDIIAYEGA